MDNRFMSTNTARKIDNHHSVAIVGNLKKNKTETCHLSKLKK